METVTAPLNHVEMGLHSAAMDRDPGQIYAGIWTDYRNALAAFASVLAGLGKRECETVHLARDMPPATRWGDQRSEEVQTARNIVWALVREAQTRFTPPGCTALDIPRKEYEYHYVDLALGSARNHDAWAEAFDPQAVWGELADTYGSEEGADTAFRQAGAALWKLLRLRKSGSVSRRGGAPVVKLPLFIDPWDKKYSGKNRLTYNSREDVHEALRHFGTFGVWANADADFSNGLRRAWATLGWNATDHELRSRQKVPLGSMAHMVVFLSRLEFVLGGRLGEQFQVFMGLFGEGRCDA